MLLFFLFFFRSFVGSECMYEKKEFAFVIMVLGRVLQQSRVVCI
jgi:hypothetical protein